MRLGFRGALLALLLGVLVLTAGLVGGAANYNARFAVNDLGQQLFEQGAGRIQAHIDRMLEDAATQGRLNAGLIESGTLPADDHETMTAYFLEALKANPGLSYLSFGTEDGRYWHVFRDAMGDISVQWLLPNDEGGFDLIDYLPREDGSLEETFRDRNTDRTPPYERPYYIAAKEAGESTWPETYIFLSAGGSFDIPGLTRATPVYAKDGGFLGVLTADFDLIALSRYLERFRVREDSLSFLLELRDDGTRRIIAHPGAPVDVTLTTDTGDGGGRDSLPVEEVNDLRVRALAAKIPPERHLSNALVRDTFTVDGELYFGAYQPLLGEDKPDWLLAIAVPEENILGRVHDINRTTFGVVAGGVVLVILIALWVATRLSHPLRSAANETRAIANFELEPHPVPPSRIAEIHQLGTAIEEMKSGLRSFQKYVPAELVRSLLESGQEAQLGGERRRITLYFSDVADFTSIAESVAPDVLVKLLAEYLDVMTREMIEQGATIDKYIGDAIMAFWGAPHDMQDQALRACRTALANRDALQRLSEKWLHDGFPAFQSRIGLHTGEALVGNFGSENRLDYTAIGDNVNLASRLEGLNKMYGTTILMSEATHSEVAEQIVARRIDRVSVKGRSGGTLVYELLAMADDAAEDTRQRVREYEAALDLYFDRRFDQAAAAFDVLGQAGGPPGAVMAARAHGYHRNPPPEGWDGVYQMTSK